VCLLSLGTIGVLLIGDSSNLYPMCRRLSLPGVTEEPRQPPAPMHETVRHVEKRAREITAHGDRGSRIGLLLIVAGAVLLVVAVVGAILVSL